MYSLYRRNRLGPFLFRYTPYTLYTVLPYPGRSSYSTKEPQSPPPTADSAQRVVCGVCGEAVTMRERRLGHRRKPKHSSNRPMHSRRLITNSKPSQTGHKQQTAPLRTLLSPLAIQLHTRLFVTQGSLLQSPRNPSSHPTASPPKARRIATPRNQPSALGGLKSASCYRSSRVKLF